MNTRNRIFLSSTLLLGCLAALSCGEPEPPVDPRLAQAVAALPAWQIHETALPFPRSINLPSHACPIDLMPTVKVSPKFQVVIPRQIRETMHLRPGQEVEVMVYDNRIELIPVKPMREMRGFLKGIDTSIEREPDREL